ncbi:MAG: hypothetical protein WCF57_01310, partial [Pyrinomonadaceae bacterium]
GQQDSEWRALLTAARASQRAGQPEAARAYASRAADLLSNLQQKWGVEAYDSYSARPDVQYLRKQLGELTAVNQ